MLKWIRFSGSSLPKPTAAKNRSLQFAVRRLYSRNTSGHIFQAQGTRLKIMASAPSVAQVHQLAVAEILPSKDIGFTAQHGESQTYNECSAPMFG